MEYGLFYELVRVALGNQGRLSRTPTEKEWAWLLEVAEKQCVDGITYDALGVLTKQGQKPTEEVMLDWFSYAEQIKEQNRVVNQRCKDITELFANAGYKTCILKGQGNARMYPNPLARVSGDIDIWVLGHIKGDDEVRKSKEKEREEREDNALRKEITDFVRQQFPDALEWYHHIDFPIFKDVPVEVHFMPGKILSPKYNKRYQHWWREQKEILMKTQQDAHEVNFPSVDFNVIHQIVHLTNHFFTEGIGLRQFVDYYYLLVEVEGQRSKVKGKGGEVKGQGEVVEGLRSKVEDEDGYEDYKNLFEYLGMLKFASGVMWIERELLGLDEKYLIMEPSEKIGRLIKKEMEIGGNFGQYDSRYADLRKKGLLVKGFADVSRMAHLVSYFPTYTFWRIINKIENVRWWI